MDFKQFHQIGRKIVGVGFNYSGLLKQLGMGVPKHPRIYLKSTSSYLKPGETIKIPEWSSGLWYEVELGVVVGKPMKSLRSEKEAMDRIAGYCVTLDMTCKGNLLKAREKGFSWTIAKCFDGACPTGEFISKEQLESSGVDVNDLNLWLKVDGETRQKGNTNEMSWSIGKLLCIMSEYMTLEPGDLILTGTPTGMDLVRSGEVITAGIQGIGEIRFPVQ